MQGIKELAPHTNSISVPEPVERSFTELEYKDEFDLLYLAYSK